LITNIKGVQKGILDIDNLFSQEEFSMQICGKRNVFYRFNRVGMASSSFSIEFIRIVKRYCLHRLVQLNAW